MGPARLLVDRLRAETPGVVDHIHLNNAGAALPSRPVLDRQIAHLELEARVGGYRAARMVAAELHGVRASIGRLVGADAGEVALHQSATDAWNTAVVSFLMGLEAGDRVVMDRAVYGSHAITLLRLARRLGLDLAVVQDDAVGQLDVDHLAALVARPRTRLVCLTHIPTSSGLVNPVEAAGAVCRAHGVHLVLDACQSAGQVPLDMARIGCSALAATGRKYLRGPRGTGFLVVDRTAFGAFEPFAPDLRAAAWTGAGEYALVDDARRYETWEHGVAGLLALGVAVDAALGHTVAALSDRIERLADTLRVGLSEVPGVTVRDKGDRLCGICTFDVRGQTATDVAEALHARGVRVSVTHKTSAQLDLGARELDAVVRASVHAYNTDAELEEALDAVRAVVG